MLEQVTNITTLASEFRAGGKSGPERDVSRCTDYSDTQKGHFETNSRSSTQGNREINMK